MWAAVAQRVELVVHRSEGRWFDSRFTCRCVRVHNKPKRSNPSPQKINKNKTSNLTYLPQYETESEADI